MMSKIVFLVFMLLAALFSNAQKVVDVIDDHGFMGKIGLQGTSSLEPSIKKYLKPFNSNEIESRWMLAEWGSKHDLLNAKAVINAGRDNVYYFNKSKGIYFKKDNYGTIIGLEILGSQEIEKARELNENFPGMLLGQGFNEPHRISDFQKLSLNLKTRLVYVENKMNRDEYNESLHTAQITLYFSLGNVNKDSEGYGDYLWFGIPIYDFRYKDIGVSWMQDTGIEGATQKFIYVPAAKEFYKGSMHDKKWISIKKVNILPYLEAAFMKAQEMGYLQTTGYKDLALTSTNFGWEMPGIFDALYEFKDLRLLGVFHE